MLTCVLGPRVTPSLHTPLSYMSRYSTIAWTNSPHSFIPRNDPNPLGTAAFSERYLQVICKAVGGTGQKGLTSEHPDNNSFIIYFALRQRIAHVPVRPELNIL